MSLAIPFRLTSLQRQMLLRLLAAPHAGVEIQQSVVDLPEQIDRDAFRRAWRAVVARHDALRLRFLIEDLDDPRQVPQDRLELPFAEEDWRLQSPDRQEEDFRRFLDDDRRAGFEVEGQLFARATLVRLGEARWRLVFTHWHGTGDGRSGFAIVHDLFALYEAFRDRRDPGLPEVPPFSRFIEWLDAQRFDAADAYWRDVLQTVSEPTPLGIARPAAAGADWDHQEMERRLGAEASARLAEFSRAHKLSPAILMQAAWTLVLSRCSDRDDVVFGTTRAGRRSALDGDPAAGPMVGLLINTVPIRRSVDPQASVLQWLETMRQQDATLRRFEHTPLEIIHRASGLPPDRVPYDSLLLYDHLTFDSALRSLGGAWRDRRTTLHERTGVPLTVYGYGERDFLLKIAFDRRQFESAAIRRMLGHLAQVLEQFVEHPDRAVGRVPVLTDDERRTLVVDWNRTSRDLPPDATVHGAIAAQASRTPAAPAVTCPGETVTCAELDARAGAIAARLRAAGVGRGAIVGICLERSIDLVTGLLGTLKAGAAYLPLDPTYPRERLALMIDDAQPAAILAGEGTAGRLPPVDVPLLDPADGGEPVTAPPPEATGGEDLAYVIYTSGSTGRPKGVMIEHRHVLNLFAGLDEVVGAGPGVWLAVTSISFDIAVVELLWTLARGFHVVLRPDAELRAAALRRTRADVPVVSGDDSLDGLIRRYGATHLQCTPSLLRLALAAPDARAAFASLDVLMIGGEPLPASLVRDLGAAPARRVINMYGPTETTVWSAAWPVPDGARSIGIGRPIANTRIYILDSHRRLAPIGAAGELYIGGAGVARGYFHRPELTRERFVSDPFVAGERLYRTGDLARYAEDGTLQFIGRVDQQVKIRGHRIELGEIETALRRLEGIDDAAVDVRQDDSGNPRLVAYVVASDETLPDAGALRTALVRTLPEYMVPSLFVPLPALPLTPNGKIDRKALPAPPCEAGDASASTGPMTDAEQRLAAIWAGVLGVAGVDRRDNFFDRGGHSLLAAQVVVRIREAFGVSLAIRQLFETPVLADLAALLARRQGDVAPLVRIASTVASGDLEPASYAQEQVWVHEQLAPGTAAYHIPIALRLRGELDVPALAAALADLVTRHEALRTSLTMERGSVHQRVASDATLDVRILDAAGETGEERERAAAALLAADAARPFDLRRAPLARAALVTVGPADRLLSLVVHHAVCDGWSVEVMLRELGALYAARVRGTAPALAPLPIRYADFARWQRDHAGDQASADQMAFWRRRLAGAPSTLSLPADRPRPPVQTFRGARLPIAIEPDLAARVRAVGRRYEATPFMVLMAAFQTWLARVLRREDRDLVVGTPVAARTRPEVEGLVGFFANTVAIRVDATDAPTFAALLARTRDAVLDAHAHQELPFEKVVGALNPERALSHSPVFQVMFALQADASDALRLPDVAAEPVYLETGAAKVDLSLWLFERRDGSLNGFVEYACDLFDAASIERMVRQFLHLLNAAADAPDTDVEALRLLDAGDRRLLLEEWNRTGREVAFVPVHRQIAAQAAAAPDAEALVFGRRTLTRRDLERRTNQLASYLGRLGAGPDRLVAVQMERSADLAVALTAVLKAGAAYVPVDPAYPRERIEFMIGDCQPAVFLTESHLQRPRTDAQVVLIDQEWSRIEREPADRSVEDSRPDHLAYVMYTSGSTGMPKGVMIEHRNLTNFLAAMDDVIGREPGVWLAITSVSFDIAGLELLWTLARGFRVVIRPDSRLRAAVSGDDVSVSQLIRRHRVTHLQGTPSMLRTVAATAEGVAALAALKQLLIGGEPLPASLLAALGDVPGRRILNMYGPTETTIWSTALDVRAGAPGSIGRPVANTNVYILDDRRQPVPIGVPGEIYIGGAGVARGYLGRHDLTAERFPRDPFDPAGAAMYRTGDLGRFRADGQIEFLGRTDRQVKIRGHRIELKEIEAVLRSLPGVAEAAVDARPDRRGDLGLVGYVVPAPGVGADPDDLRQALGARLPSVMVPPQIVTLAALPQTPNGKLDRRALPQPDEPELPAAPGREGTQLEQAIAALWREALALDRVGLDDDFFESGGTSLSAIHLMTLVQQRFGIDVPVHLLVTAPTIAKLTEHLRARGVPDAAAAPAAVAGQAPAGRASRPTTSDQELRLRDAWARVLGRIALGPDENVLAAGSATPAALLEAARAALGILAEGVPMRMLLEHPTASGFVKAVDRHASVDASLLVPLEAMAGGRPLFLIHAGGGYVFFYRALASHFRGRHGVFGIQASVTHDTPDDPFAPSRTIEDLAARYISEIRRVQPSGPYFLGGACFGGVIAFEMSRQLLDEGDRVDLLALFSAFVLNNPRAPGGGRPAPPLTSRLGGHLRLAAELPLHAAVAYLGGKVANDLTIRGRRAADAGRRGLRKLLLREPSGRIDPAVRLYERCTLASLRYLDTYVPRPVDVRAMLFRGLADEDPAPLWRGLTRRGLDLIEMPGGHLDMLEDPAAAGTAGLMLGHLDHAAGTAPAAAQQPGATGPRLVTLGPGGSPGRHEPGTV